MKKEKKNQEIEFLKQNLNNSQGIFISKYQGLNVEKFSLLRKEMRSHGALLKVFKNTLSRIAFKQTYAEAISGHLEGPNFLIFTNDPMASSKALLKFAQENPENIEIKAGYYQTILDKSRITTLATLPSKDILISRFISVIKSPEVRLVFTLRAPVVNLIRILQAVEAKKSA
ncbi:MAG: 50S ribosomal protein L10 [Deltaproteobacteria bacterium]|nr:50S ribosomal protein L10 [Deltaproteobacteria bacterium]MCL5892713.1 50S ribosomal protein L10 [Deltaproteobacteria bacterium]MDA8053683.1 50S ribosomal protein L10 [Deltaproteobacteria bacterium]